MADSRSMHVIKGLPSDLLNARIVDIRRLKTESEAAISGAVVAGDVFSFFYEFELSAGELFALNVYPDGVAAVRRIVIYSETPIEAAIFNAYATGTEGANLEPTNINFCSNKQSAFYLSPVPSAVPNGSPVYIGVDNLETPVIICDDKEAAIVFRRLTNGAASTVRISVIIEELNSEIGLVGLKPVTPWVDDDPWVDDEPWID